MYGMRLFALSLAHAYIAETVFESRPPKPPADAGNIPRVLEKAEACTWPSFPVKGTIDLLGKAAKVLENLRRLLSGLRVRALDLEDRHWAADAFDLEACQTAGAAD